MQQSVNELVLDDLSLQRRSDVPLQEQILVFLRRGICAGRLRAGSRMPSSRALASALGISRTTVVEVYSRLEAEGYIIARPRAGNFVTAQMPGTSSAATDADAMADDERARAPTTASETATRAGQRPGKAGRSHSDQLVSDTLMPLAPGIPAVDRFPWKTWTRLSAQVLRRHAVRAFASADPQGERPLREAVAEYLAAYRGLPCHPDQVVIANGSQPLVELFIRALGQPGDRIWFEEPGDPASRSVLQGLGLVPELVPVDRHGLDVDQGIRRAPDVRFALVATSHHYPLTVTLSTQRRRALLDFSASTGAWIIENEIDCDFRFSRRVREPLYTLDDTGHVIYLGSFNKSIAPGLRIGYAVVPESLVPQLAGMSPTVSVHQQLLLAKFWASGHLASHLRELRDVHTRRRTTLFSALREMTAGLLDLDPPPEYGLRIAARLRDGVEDGVIVRAAHKAGVRIGRPISACYAGSERQAGITIGFASTPADRIRPAVERLADVLAAFPGSAASA